MTAELELRPAVALVAGPLLAILGWVVLTWDGLSALGLDRALVGWTIGVPCLVLAPAVLGAAFSDPLPASRARARAVASAFVGAFVLLGASFMFFSGIAAGCNHAIDPIQVLPEALAVAAGAGLSVGVPIWVSRRRAAEGRVAAGIVEGSVIAFVALAGLAFVVLLAFPPLSCAPGPAVN